MLTSVLKAAGAKSAIESTERFLGFVLDRHLEKGGTVGGPAPDDAEDESPDYSSIEHRSWALGEAGRLCTGCRGAYVAALEAALSGDAGNLFEQIIANAHRILLIAYDSDERADEIIRNSLSHVIWGNTTLAAWNWRQSH